MPSSNARYLQADILLYIRARFSDMYDTYRVYSIGNNLEMQTERLVSDILCLS